MFGKLLNCNRQNNDFFFEFENGNGKIEVINSKIIRVFSGDDKIKSKAIEGDKKISAEVSFENSENGVIVKTDFLTAIITDDFKVDFFDNNKNCLCRDKRGDRTLRTKFDDYETENMPRNTFLKETAAMRHKVEIVKEMNGDECFYGLGDKPGFLNKRHYEYVNWNSDVPPVHTETTKALYKTVPFFITLKNDCCYGIFFDNTYKSYFSMGKESDSYYYFAADGGNLDYYFISGEKMPEILSGYTYLTGTMPVPQKWTLGYHQSRWTYKSEGDVRALVKKFREEKLPLDAVHLDIDYMKKFEDFTWDKERFPDMKKLCADLEKEGVKVVTIIDAGVKKLEGYKIYDEGIKNDYFVKNPDGSVYENVVWPGDSVFPDMGKPEVQTWWKNNQKIIVDAGIRGIWNDMNEPASFRGEIPDDIVFSDGRRKTTHSEMHNVYGSLMSKATFEGLKEFDKRRPYVITRACYSGVQKYSTVWTGDNHSIWDHVRLSITQLCNLSLSGIPFGGADIGGFLDDTAPELLARWVEVGCLSPLFRNHSELMSIRQEPWVFGKEVEDIYRKFINLRYTLIPYYYDLFFSGEKTGLPVLRPLVFDYQNDGNVKNLNTEFMVGPSIIAAPVVEQGAKEKLVYLPAGTFYDFFTGEKVEGGKSFIKKAPLDVLPLYVKAGGIIPLYPVQNYIGEKEIDVLELNVYPGNGTYTHFEDDGESYGYREGKFNEYFIEEKDETLSIECVHKGYEKHYKNYKVNYLGKCYEVDAGSGKVVIKL